jgi:hypothetical protein
VNLGLSHMAEAVTHLSCGACCLICPFHSYITFPGSRNFTQLPQTHSIIFGIYVGNLEFFSMKRTHYVEFMVIRMSVT